MKTLLLHPEDSARLGPWSKAGWDLLVELGRASEPQVSAWKRQFQCEVLALDCFRQGYADLGRVREILFAGRGRMLDSAGLDWWELNGIEFHEELEQAVLLRRLAAEWPGAGEIYSSRECWQADALSKLLGREIRTLDSRGRGKLRRYQKAAQRLTMSQMLEVAFDKHDPEYKWRGRLSRPAEKAKRPRVLVPSAYINVSRMAADYARLLPEHSFLLAATRASALRNDAPANMTRVSLAAYVNHTEDPSECAQLLRAWQGIRAELEAFPEFSLLGSLGRLERFAQLLRQGLAVRDAWQALFSTEEISSVLCGDDSNPPTRIPVSLARMKGLPAVDFHHGAFDGRFLIKSLPADVYLAKSAMERDYLVLVCGLEAEKVVIGAPRGAQAGTGARSPSPGHIVLFSEPYEAGGSRAEEVYREILPPLAALAGKLGLGLMVKLHPFESLRERRRLVKQVVTAPGPPLSVVADIPLAEVLCDAYCGVTVESSTVLDCAQQGVPCFLCGWRALSSFGYTQQYSRYGVGRVLNSPAGIDQIPHLIADQAATVGQEGMWQKGSPEALAALLSGKVLAHRNA